jgi:hypothetical protein
MAHERGKAHEFTSEEAAAAGKKGDWVAWGKAARRRRLVVVTCRQCGVEFHAHQPTAKSCSARYRVAWHCAKRLEK